MPDSSGDKFKKQLRIIVLAVVGVVAFTVSVFMNIVGMRDAIQKAPDSSGMAWLSVRVKENKIDGKKQEIKVDKSGNIVEEDILVNALPIINLNNNNWDRIKAKFTGFQLDENGNAVFEEDGYTLFCNDTYVNYVVFNSNFKKDVIGHIKVGTDFEEIEEELGVPTFKREDCLGYKTREVYAFFYKDEIVVYPNKNISNSELEKLFNSYLEKTYERGRSYLLVEIRRDYKDFIIEEDLDTDIITITSATRKMKARLDGLGNIQLELYDGYNIALDKTKEYIEQKLYVQYEEDLVDMIEYERVNGK